MMFRDVAGWCLASDGQQCMEGLQSLSGICVKRGRVVYF
jgi:hypothetical protein